jgi:cytochrome c-type biogenesis protein CcmE
MTHRYIKITITTLVLVVAFGGLLWSTLRDEVDYYKTVNEVMTDRQAWEGKRLQLKGYVVPGSIYRKRDSLDYRFQVQNGPARSGSPGHVVEATFTGIVPDTFKDEAEVVLKGRLTAEGFRTDPNGVVAKCPSKYEEAARAIPSGS